MNCNFQVPLFKSRIFPIDQPEILIPALLVVGTKLCFPFPTKQGSLLSQADGLALRFNWQKWTSLKEGTGEEYKTLYADSQFRNTTAEQVVSMDDGQLDSYLGYMSHLVHSESKLDTTHPVSRILISSDKDQITQFFPVKEPPRLETPAPQLSDAEMDERAQEVIQAIMAPLHGDDEENDANESESEEKEAGYEAFRDSKDLSDIARKFYTVTGNGSPIFYSPRGNFTNVCVANLAGLRLETLTRAVYMLEQKIIKWQRRKRRAEDEDIIGEAGAKTATIYNSV